MDLSIRIMYVPINNTLCYCLGRLDIILKNSRISLYLFIRFLFNFIVLRSRATSHRLSYSMSDLWSREFSESANRRGIH